MIYEVQSELINNWLRFELWKKYCFTLRWRHNEHDCVSNHQRFDCLLNRLLMSRSKKTSKLCVTGLCVGNSPGPVNSPHKGPVTRKMFLFDDVIMQMKASGMNLNKSIFIDKMIYYFTHGIWMKMEFPWGWSEWYAIWYAIIFQWLVCSNSSSDECKNLYVFIDCFAHNHRSPQVSKTRSNDIHMYNKCPW